MRPLASASVDASDGSGSTAGAALQAGSSDTYRVFDAHTEEYDRWFTEHPAIYDAEVRAIRRLMLREGVGVEIGVGTGRFAVPLGITIGVEPAWHMAAVAKARGVAVCLALGERLPFRDAAFDFVLLVTVMCFVSDVPSLLREAYRVLKPGGHLINAFIDRTSPLGQAYEARRATHTFYRYARFYSATEARACTLEVGFRELRFCQTIRGLPGSFSSGAYDVRDGYGEGAFVVIRGTK